MAIKASIPGYMDSLKVRARQFGAVRINQYGTLRIHRQTRRSVGSYRFTSDAWVWEQYDEDTDPEQWWRVQKIVEGGVFRWTSIASSDYGYAERVDIPKNWEILHAG